MRLTAADVDDVWLPSAPWGTRGYNTMQVNAFLRRIAATLDDRDHVTAADVGAVAFTLHPTGRRGGYDPGAVDAFLRVVERALAIRERADHDRDAPRPEPDDTHDRPWRRITA
ncbi:DivIVA domain-containing protein [Saccharomonospora halophila]|uniref:DivIVA domain-containing protein n=1 Tax=Saccharomonospora halophila TaxID=129922 RepID=UPI000367B075|nr:DivIVA domain-containing protein [Saccharomonospora halophila]